MILNSMKIENFKGIKSRQILFSRVTEIIGANGVGKSTVYSAFTWCLFGKDSLGQAQFGIEPRDKYGNLILAIPKVEIDIDGTVLTRELHNSGVRNRFTIDGVTKSLAEYKAFVDSMIPEDTFKTLTDVHYVCGSMHWTARRELLLSLAGEIGSPVGFDDLIGELKGRTMLEFKALCQKEKLRITKARDEIQPRIDEIQRGLDQYAGTDESAEAKRTSLQAELETLEKARQDLLKQEKERQEVIAQVQKLRTAQITREAFLRTDNSRVAGLVKEKNDLANEAQQWLSDQQSLEWSIKEKQRIRVDVEQQVSNSEQRLSGIRAAYHERRKPITEPVVTDTTCPTCGQGLPSDQIQAITAKAQERHANDCEEQRKALASLKAQGDQYNQQIKIDSETIATLEAEIAKLKDELIARAMENNLKAKANTIKINRIDAQIKADVKVAPEMDPEWMDLSTQISALTIGESVADQMEIIEQSKSELNAELVAINNILAQADRSEKDKARIEQLEDQEKVLNDQIMELEKRLMQISDYTRAESDMITAAVNGRFKHVTWRLFNDLKNGNTEDACVPMLNGVDYTDLSYGEKILVGLDIVNVLAAQYGVTVPLFVDNAESYTPEIEWCGQVIRLVHKKSQKTLKIA